VTDTVERAMERGLRPNISITVTSLNLDGAGEAAAFALERNLPFNVNFYRECARARAGRRAAVEPRPGPTAGGDARHFGHRPGPSDLSAAADGDPGSDPAGHPPQRHMLGRARLSGGGTTGQVSACQMMLEERGDAGRRGPAERGAATRRGAVQAGGRRSRLPGLHVALGVQRGCPLLRKSVLHGDYCQVYRALFPELVQLRPSG